MGNQKYNFAPKFAKSEISSPKFWATIFRQEENFPTAG